MSLSSTFSSDLRRFLARVVLFSTPLLLPFLAFECIVWWTGDAWPAAAVGAVQRSTARDSIYGRGEHFSDQFSVYKTAGIRAVQPSLLVAGSSRVLQLRERMAHPLEAGFYNAGGLVQNASDVRRLADSIADGDFPKPSLLLLGIDPWWFKTGSEGESPAGGERDHALDPGTHLEAFRRALRPGRIRATIQEAALPSVHEAYGQFAIGTFARRAGSGFRHDGSRQYNPAILRDYAAAPRFIDREEPPVVDRIRTLTGQFSPPSALDSGKVGLVLDSTQRLVGLGIETWILLPPFSSESLRALDEQPALAPIWRYYHDEFTEAARARGARVIPALSPAAYGLADDYMIDGFHGSEVLMAIVLREAIAGSPAGSALRRIDLAALDDAIRSADSPLSFTPPPRSP